MDTEGRPDAVGKLAAVELENSGDATAKASAPESGMTVSSDGRWEWWWGKATTEPTEEAKAASDGWKGGVVKLAWGWSKPGLAKAVSVGSKTSSKSLKSKDSSTPMPEEPKVLSNPPEDDGVVGTGVAGRCALEGDGGVKRPEKGC